MSKRLRVLRDSVEHLSDVASSLQITDYTSPAFPSEWTIADTFSHLGSGAIIGQRSFDDSIAGRESDPAFNPSVWDQWNNKDPRAQVDDSLASDAAFLASLEATSEEQRENFLLSMGPFTFDFDGFIGLRLSEHALHTWDIEVALNPAATVANDTANTILESVQFIVARTGKPVRGAKSISVRTIDPVRDFSLVLDADAVDLVETSHEKDPDLVIPAEGLVRLIYGRSDKDHTPGSVDSSHVEVLRQVFPGF